MALTKEDLQAIEQLLDKKLEPIKEQQEVHTRSITQMENAIMNELKLLNENLPSAIARHEKVAELEHTVNDHGDRIFALEQAANE